MIKALALFSGGLDSILAARVVMEQGIEVEAVQFVTPFFNYKILEDVEAHKASMLRKYGLNVIVEDISEGYLELLHNPAHGFGKNFNPCIDCKIMMFSRAKAMLAEKGASFLISGEVLGQRPMSQRRDTMNAIERDSGTRSILLRPLCAQLMNETEPEKQGLVDRSRLLRMSGRGRSAQIALAKQYGITDYPAPAGGCILADPILSRRIKSLYCGESAFVPAEIAVEDVRLLLVGRQFMLPDGGWLVVGRDERENDRILDLATAEDIVLMEEEWPGPVALLRKAAVLYPGDAQREADIRRAAGLVVRYGKKVSGEGIVREITCTYGTSEDGAEKVKIAAEALSDEEFEDWIVT